MTWFTPEVIAKEVSAATNRRFLRPDENLGPGGSIACGFGGFLTPVNSRKQG